MRVSRQDRMLKAIRNAGGKFWDVKAATNQDGGAAGEVFIYGYIVGTKWFDDDVAPKALKDEIDALGDIETLYVRINSPGGSVFAGNAIYNILRRVDAEIIATIDGLAASAASVIAMAADKVVIAKNAQFMIHDPWTFAVGNSTELRKAADVLDTIQKGFVAVYKEKTGLSEDEIKNMLAEDTWMDAEEAKEKGFVDEIDGALEVAASLVGDKLVVNGQEFDASIFGVLPPFEGIESAGGRTRGLERNASDNSDASPGAIRRAFAVIAKALGFDGEPKRDGADDEPGGLASPVQAQALADALIRDVSATEQNTHETKGSGETMSETKNPQAVQDPTSAPAADIKDMDHEAIAARLAELEARAKAAEDLAKAERDRRVEAEFIDRVEGYGTLPISASDFGPVMKRASEALAKEDFEQIEAVLKAAGAALGESEMFQTRGVSGDGDSSAAGQFRAEVAKVKAANPGLSDAEAKVMAFKSLPENVQKQVYGMNILPM